MKDLNIVILQLLIALKSDLLEDIIFSDGKNAPEVVLEILISNNEYYLYSLLCRKLFRDEEALNTFKKLLSKELIDSRFKGSAVYVEYLRNLSKKDLVLQYSCQIFEHDPIEALTVSCCVI